MAVPSGKPWEAVACPSRAVGVRMPFAAEYAWLLTPLKMEVFGQIRRFVFGLLPRNWLAGKRRQPLNVQTNLQMLKQDPRFLLR